MQDRDIAVLALSVLRKLPATIETQFSEDEKALLTPTSSGIRFFNQEALDALQASKSTLATIVLGSIKQQTMQPEWQRMYTFPPPSEVFLKRAMIAPQISVPQASDLKLPPLPEIGVQRMKLDAILDSIAAESDSPLVPLESARG